MGIGKWLARRGNIGGTARAVAKGWMTFKEQNPEMKPIDVANTYIEFRYKLTGEDHMIDNVLLVYDICPLELTWSILMAENKGEIHTLYDHEDAWKEIIKEKIKKKGLDPEDRW